MPRQKISKKKKKVEQVDALRIVSAGIKDMSLVEGMDEERIVPTMMTGYNRAMSVGGHPIGCMCLVHGPNQVGKTVWALMVAESIRRWGHASVVFDTEFAGEKEWYSLITPKSGYKRVGSLDDMFNDVALMCENLRKAHGAKAKDKKLPKSVGACFVVDTVTKLQPNEVKEKIKKEGIKKSFSIQALYNSIWSKSIIPELYYTNSTLIIVSQERVNLDAKGPFASKRKIAGGKAFLYDNRVRISVDYSKSVKCGDKVVGTQSFYKVANNKISGTTFQESSFFTSTGTGSTPKGLDLAREALEEAKFRKWIVKSGDEVTIRWKPLQEMLRRETIDGGWSGAADYFVKNEEDRQILIDELNANLGM